MYESFVLFCCHENDSIENFEVQPNNYRAVNKHFDIHVLKNPRTKYINKTRIFAMNNIHSTKKDEIMIFHRKSDDKTFKPPCIVYLNSG